MHNTQHHNHAPHGHHYKHPWSFLGDIEKMGDEYLVRKAPLQIPHKRKDVIAKLLPILVLIVACIAIPGILAGAFVVLGLAGSSGVERGFYRYAPGAAYTITLIQFVITITVTVIYFKAFDPLRKRKYIGRAYVFYTALLSLVANLIDGGVLGALIGFLIMMFLLFQTKELYH